MKHFKNLSDDELLKEKNRYNDIVNKYQEPIDNYNIHYKNYLEAKRNGDELIIWDHHKNTEIIKKELGWKLMNLKEFQPKLINMEKK